MRSAPHNGRDPARALSAQQAAGKFGSPKTVPTRTVTAGMNPVQLGFRPIKPDEDDYLNNHQSQQQLLKSMPLDPSRPRANSAQEWADPLGRQQPRASSARTQGNGPNKRRDYFGPDEWNDPSLQGNLPPVSGLVANGTAIKAGRYDSNSYSALEDNNALTSRRIRDDLRESELIDYEDDGGDSLLDSVAEMDHHDGHMRIFIALFDYDPETMSPNPDAASLELAFKEGQLLRVSCKLFVTTANNRLVFKVVIIYYIKF